MLLSVECSSVVLNLFKKLSTCSIWGKSIEVKYIIIIIDTDRHSLPLKLLFSTSVLGSRLQRFQFMEMRRAENGGACTDGCSPPVSVRLLV